MKEKLSKISTSTKVVVVVIILAFAGIVAIGNIYKGDLNAKYSAVSENEAKIKTLRAETNVEVNATPDEAEILLELNDLSDFGDAVAKCQNAFFEGKDPKELNVELHKIADSDDIDFYGRWITMPIDTLKWEFGSSHVYDNRVIPVVWLCKDTKNQNIYGYVTADYYVKDNRVSNFNLNTTSFYSEIMNKQFTPGDSSNVNETVPATTVGNGDTVSAIDKLLGGN